MACFIVPAAEAAIVTVVRRIAERRTSYDIHTVNPETSLQGALRRTRWLTNLLWGGSTLLAFEHIWHGEVQPWFPFLTAMRDPDATAEMLHEMATTGVGMAALVTVVWIGMVLVDLARAKRQEVQ